MMIGNHVTTSTLMTQWLCIATSFMHDKPDWWVEYDALMGIDMSLKDVRPAIYDGVVQGGSTS